MSGTGDVDAGDGGVDPAEVSGLVAELSAAAEAVAEAEAAVEERGEADLERTREAYRRATDLLDRYEERATGTGDFEAFVEFQERFETLVEGLPEGLSARDAFGDADELLQQRRLSSEDFERAREALSAATEAGELLDRRAGARSRLETAVRNARRRRRELGERAEELARIERLGDADLDAPVERLREPVEAYDEAVRESFAGFKRDASARKLLSFVGATAAYPLVDYRQPPAELRRYVESKPAGEEPVPTLLEYADYSRSKLDHYVDDAGALKTRVAVHRTYLERLDASPLTVSWPPPPADLLRYRTRELIPVVARFAPEPTVARLRELRVLATGDRYGRLREAAVAREELDGRERERLRAGDVAAERERVREAREALAEALEAHA